MQTLDTVEIPPELGLGFGDFVWGRIKNYQWWPGQVSDPSKALDGAKKGHKNDGDSVLVSYFGSYSFVWCNPSQLKPFVECFDQIVNPSSSKSFRAALDLAIGEISKCLEAQLSCSCWSVEGRSGYGKISNYSAEEFLGLVKTVAVDRSVVNLLEITMLRSWVSGFEGGIDTGHMRKVVSELVDKIDLGVPVAEAIEGKEEENDEGLVSRSRVLKSLDRGRKKRSMAVLIAQMDLDSVEVSDGNVEKKEVRKDLDSVEVSDGDEEEKEIRKDLEIRMGDVGSGRRERKKSKYLSPPYTHLSGGATAKSLVSPKSPKSLRAFPLEPSSTVVKSTTEGLHKEEVEKCSPLFEVDELDPRELLSELRATAASPLHLKWNRLAKTERGFFAEFRKLVSSNGVKFDAYEKQLVEPVGQDGKIVNTMVDDKCADGKKIEGNGGRKRKDIFKGEGETLVDKSGEGKETEGERGRKRKDVANGEGETLGDKPEDGKKSERKKGRKKKDAVDGEGETPGDGDESKDDKKPGRKGRKKMDVVNGEGETPGDKSEDGKTSERKRGRKRKDVVNSEGESPVDTSGDGKKTEGRRGRKKKDKVDTEGETPIDLSQQTAKHLEENDKASGNVKSGCKRGRKKADSIQNIIGDLSCQTVINVELKETGQIQTKGEEVAHTKSTKKVTLRLKRKNSKDGPIIDVPINLGSEIINGSGEKKSKRKKNSKNSTSHEDPAAILLTFSSEITLPSKEYLISTLSKYGSVIQSETEILKESNSAKVVFARSSDAEKAFNDKIAAFGLPVASYRLRYLTGNLSSPSSPTLIPVQKPPLPSIRKSLVRMISSLSGSALETRDNLVGDMHGLLMKVDKLMTEPAMGNST